MSSGFWAGRRREANRRLIQVDDNGLGLDNSGEEKTKADKPESCGAGYGDRKKLYRKLFLGPSPALCVWSGDLWLGYLSVVWLFLGVYFCPSQIERATRGRRKFPPGPAWWTTECTGVIHRAWETRAAASPEPTVKVTKTASLEFPSPVSLAHPMFSKATGSWVGQEGVRSWSLRWPKS